MGDTIPVEEKQIHMGKWGNTEAWQTAMDAIRKYRCSNWGRSNSGLRAMFLDFCTAYVQGRIEV